MKSDRCGCGGKAILTDYTVEGAAKQYSVACETCFMGLPYGFDTPGDAWAAWRRAMGGPQPDPITGLVPCEYCTDHKNLYDDKYTDVEMLDDFIHVDVRTQYEGWSFGFYINYCPMCGRKLTAPPRPGAIGPETGEMAPNGDEGAEL